MTLCKLRISALVFINTHTQLAILASLSQQCRSCQIQWSIDGASIVLCFLFFCERAEGSQRHSHNSGTCCLPENEELIRMNNASARYWIVFPSLEFKDTKLYNLVSMQEESENKEKLYPLWDFAIYNINDAKCFLPMFFKIIITLPDLLRVFSILITRL